MTAHALCVDRASLLFECSVEKNDKIIQICGDIERKIYYRFGKNISQPELKMTRSFGDYQLYSGNNEVGRNFDYKLQLKNGTYIYNLNFIDLRVDPKVELVVSKGTSELAKLSCKGESIYPPLEKQRYNDLVIFASAKTKFSNGWIFENKTLHPECFYMEQWSSEVYKDYYKTKTGSKENFFSSAEYKDFSNNPGKYFKKLDNILSTSLEKCKNFISKEFRTNHMDGVVYSSSGDRLFETYYLEEKISKKNCMELAPNIEGKCLESYLLNRSHWGGGSMTLNERTIYGIFKDKTKGIFILPLKRFN